MIQIGQDNFVPNESPVLINWVRSEQFGIRVLLLDPSLGCVLRAKMAFDFYGAHVFWSTPRCWTFLTHSTSGDFDSNNNNTLFCFVPQGLCAVESSWSLNAYNSSAPSPSDCSLFEKRG